MSSCFSSDGGQSCWKGQWVSTRSVSLSIVCIQLGLWKLSVVPNSGLSTIHQLLIYSSEWKDSWDFRNCYIIGIRFWGVSNKQGSTVHQHAFWRFVGMWSVTIYDMDARKLLFRVWLWLHELATEENMYMCTDYTYTHSYFRPWCCSLQQWFTDFGYLKENVVHSLDNLDMPIRTWCHDTVKIITALANRIWIWSV